MHSVEGFSGVINQMDLDREIKFFMSPKELSPAEKSRESSPIKQLSPINKEAMIRERDAKKIARAILEGVTYPWKGQSPVEWENRK